MWLQSHYPSFFLLPSSFLLLLSRLLSDAAYPPDEISFWISIAVGVISGLRFLILPHSTPILSTETVLTLPRLPCELHLLLSTSCLPPEPIPPLAARQNVARTAPSPPLPRPEDGTFLFVSKIVGMPRAPEEPSVPHAENVLVSVCSMCIPI